MSYYDDLVRCIDIVAAAPKPIAYIVLDHHMPTWTHIDGHDADGRRYLRVTPALMDEFKHGNYEPLGIAASSTDVAKHLCAIPVYRYDQMPEGWPL